MLLEWLAPSFSYSLVWLATMFRLGYCFGYNIISVASFHYIPPYQPVWRLVGIKHSLLPMAADQQKNRDQSLTDRYALCSMHGKICRGGGTGAAKLWMGTSVWVV